MYLFSRRFAVLTGLCSLLLLPSFAAQAHPVHSSGHKAHLKALTVSQLARLALPSIVRLTVLNAQGQPSVQGSGVVVGPNLIITNMHVIKNAHAVTANFQNGRSEKVYGLVGLDIDRDLALMYVDTKGVRPLPLALDNEAQVGDAVVAAGSPEGLGGSISTGIVSGIRKMGSTRIIQTTAPISHGSSGGALLDMYGRVLGITSFYLGDGQNLNFAYAAYYVHQLMPRKVVAYSSWQVLEPLWDKPTGNSQTAAANPPPTAAPPAPTNSASPHSQPAADTALFTEKPLEGLGGVCVNVIITDAAKEKGLNDILIKADIETRLRRASITIYDKINDPHNLSFASLMIAINTSDLSDGLCLYTVEVNEKELITLRRPVPALTGATVWIGGYSGTIGAGNLTSALTQDVEDSVDKFATDYITQNAKSH